MRSSDNTYTFYDTTPRAEERGSGSRRRGTIHDASSRPSSRPSRGVGVDHERLAGVTILSQTPALEPLSQLNPLRRAPPVPLSAFTSFARAVGVPSGMPNERRGAAVVGGEEDAGAGAGGGPDASSRGGGSGAPGLIVAAHSRSSLGVPALPDVRGREGGGDAAAPEGSTMRAERRERARELPRAAPAAGRTRGATDSSVFRSPSARDH